MRANRIDENQPAIVKALRARGWSVQELNAVKDGCPDLLVGASGVNIIIEVKPGTAKDKRQRSLNELEMRWHSEWGGQVATVLTVDEAIEAVERHVLRCA